MDATMPSLGTLATCLGIGLGLSLACSLPLGVRMRLRNGIAPPDVEAREVAATLRAIAVAAVVAGGNGGLIGGIPGVAAAMMGVAPIAAAGVNDLRRLRAERRAEERQGAGRA